MKKKMVKECAVKKQVNSKSIMSRGCCHFKDEKKSFYPGSGMTIQVQLFNLQHYISIQKNKQ